MEIFIILALVIVSLVWVWLPKGRLSKGQGRNRINRDAQYDDQYYDGRESCSNDFSNSGSDGGGFSDGGGSSGDF